MMYAVYYGEGLYEDAWECVLFVTENEQLASEYVDKANAEYKEALGVENPMWESGDTAAMIKETAEYKKKLEKILKTDPVRVQDYRLDQDGSYWYNEVEVR